MIVLIIFHTLLNRCCVVHDRCYYTVKTNYNPLWISYAYELDARNNDSICMWPATFVCMHSGKNREDEFVVQVLITLARLLTTRVRATAWFLIAGGEPRTTRNTCGENLVHCLTRICLMR